MIENIEQMRQVLAEHENVDPNGSDFVGITINGLVAACKDKRLSKDFREELRGDLLRMREEMESMLLEMGEGDYANNL